MSELNISSANFQEEVMQSKLPVLLDFWAPWCGPCGSLAPIVEIIARDYEGILKVGKVNVDNETELVNTYHIAGIPTLMLFQNGSMVKRVTGFHTETELKELLNEVGIVR